MSHTEHKARKTLLQNKVTNPSHTETKDTVADSRIEMPSKRRKMVMSICYHRTTCPQTARKSSQLMLRRAIESDSLTRGTI